MPLPAISPAFTKMLRSGWLVCTPLSSTATIMFVLPVVASHAAGRSPSASTWASSARYCSGSTGCRIEDRWGSNPRENRCRSSVRPTRPADQPKAHLPTPARPYHPRRKRWRYIGLRRTAANLRNRSRRTFPDRRLARSATEMSPVKYPCEPVSAPTKTGAIQATPSSARTAKSIASWLGVSARPFVSFSMRPGESLDANAVKLLRTPPAVVSRWMTSLALALFVKWTRYSPTTRRKRISSSK